MSLLHFSHATALIEHHRGLLEAQQVDHFAPPDGQTLAFTADSKLGRCDGLLRADDILLSAPDGSTQPVILFQTFYYLPGGAVPDERLAAAFELLGMLAPDVNPGSFELDPDEQVIRYRLYQIFPASIGVPEALLMAPLFDGITFVEDHHLLFHHVLVDSMDPCHAYGAHLLVEADGEPELMERAFALLRRAQTRYERAGDVEGQEAIAGLLARVA